MKKKHMQTKAKKIGIFGGTFNPIHKGHVEALKQVQSQLQLDRVHVVPAFQNPFKVTSKASRVSNEQRLHLIRLALKGVEGVQIDTQEILRQGTSYSIDTLQNMFQQNPGSELFFIMGLDVFAQFDKWRKFEKILHLAHLVVMSRPSWQLPQGLGDLPQGVQPWVQNFTPLKVQLKSCKNIFFTALRDTEVSSTQIRDGISKGHNMSPTLPPQSAQHIYEHNLYHNQGLKTAVMACVDVLSEHKALRSQAYDVGGLNFLASYMIIASGTSVRHTQSLSELCARHLQQHYQLKVQYIEGEQEGRWIVMDYTDFLVHLFYDFLRPHYQLEQHWQQGVRIR